MNTYTNYDKRINVITSATKLWQGLEAQKQWTQNCPGITNIIDCAISQIQLEIILMCQPDKTLNKLNEKVCR